jgi:predicted lipid-binding transport protein (Tim44 family)
MNKRALLAVTLVVALSVASIGTADAKRIGGGRSFGAQRATPAAPAKAASAPSAAAPGAATDPVMPRSASAAPAAAAAAIPARTGSRWLAPLAGIAAGLGIAALMSHFGLSESFGNILVLLLLVGGGIFLLRALMGRRLANASPAPANAGGYGDVTPIPSAPRSEPAFVPAFGAPALAVSPAASAWPPGFDADQFARQALVQFRELQAAFDRSDRATLAAVMTPALYAEVVQPLAAGRLSGLRIGSVFPSLAAEVVDVTTEDAQHWVSVRFHGTVREDGAQVDEPLDEQWNLVKPVDDSSGWLLAGIQQTLAAA